MTPPSANTYGRGRHGTMLASVNQLKNKIKEILVARASRHRHGTFTCSPWSVDAERSDAPLGVKEPRATVLGQDLVRIGGAQGGTPRR